MTPDSLDQLLDRSVPATKAAPESDLRAMAVAAEAARRVKPLPKIAIGAGLAVLLAGGAGAAYAADLFDWLPWAQSPDYTYQAALAAGDECEVRVTVVDPADANGLFTGDLADRLNSHASLDAATVAAVQEVLEDYRGADLLLTSSPDGLLHLVGSGTEVVDEERGVIIDTALKSALIAEGADQASGTWTAYALQLECAAAEQ
ncbi:hypothetical protein [Microbacterium sp. P5_E9]